MKDNILEIKNLSIRFKTDAGYINALKDFSLSLKKNQIIGIVGESGSGKSVSVNAILKLLPDKAEVTGKILYNIGGNCVDLNKIHKHSKSIRHVRASEISIIFQEPMSSLSPIHKISNQMTDGMIYNGHSRKEAYNRSINLLRKVGVTSPEVRMNQYSFELSGGIKQRIMIAIALLNNPSILIADEPTTALDVTIQAQILQLIQNLQEENQMSVLYISHDMSLISNISDQIYVLYDGCLMEKGTVYEIIKKAKHPYTKGLLSSIPKADQTGRLQTIKGSIRGPYDYTQGCPFVDRCDLRIDKCKDSFPSETVSSETHSFFCHRN